MHNLRPYQPGTGFRLAFLTLYLLQRQQHNMEKPDMSDNLPPTGWKIRIYIPHFKGLELLDICSKSLPQKKSQVRALFRPLLLFPHSGNKKRQIQVLEGAFGFFPHPVAFF